MSAISFVDTPDAAGLGRVIVDGRYYGLPVVAVKEIAAWRAEAAAADEAQKILTATEIVQRNEEYNRMAAARLRALGESMREYTGRSKKDGAK